MRGPYYELVDEEKIPREERVFHRGARDMDCVDDERLQSERKRDRHAEDLRRVPHAPEEPGPARRGGPGGIRSHST